MQYGADCGLSNVNQTNFENTLTHALYSCKLLKERATPKLYSFLVQILLDRGEGGNQCL